MAKILYLLLKRMRECERDQYQFTRKIKKARKEDFEQIFQCCAVYAFLLTFSFWFANIRKTLHSTVFFINKRFVF